MYKWSLHLEMSGSGEGGGKRRGRGFLVAGAFLTSGVMRHLSSQFIALS